MELRHLRYFVAVAEELHFGRAAARLGISQPPLSRQIRDLEEELGVRLLVRNNRTVRLSGVGERFLKEARKVLASAEEALRTVRRAAGGEVGRLDLGTLHAAQMGVLSRVLPGFRKRLPAVEVRLHTMDNGDQADALHRGVLDAGLVLLPFDGRGLVVEPVLDDPLVLAMPSRHRFRKARALSLKDLDGEPYLFFRRERAPAYHDFTVDLFRRAGIRLAVTMEVDSLPMAMGMVAAGMGVALVPASLRDLRVKGVAYRDFDEPVRTGGLGVARRKETPGPVLRAFLESLRREFPVDGCPLPGAAGGPSRRARHRPAAT